MELDFVKKFGAEIADAFLTRFEHCFEKLKNVFKNKDAVKGYLNFLNLGPENISEGKIS